MNFMRMKYSVAFRFFCILILLIISGSCIMQLKNPSASPRSPISGLWVEEKMLNKNAGDFLLFQIKPSSVNEAPYSFRWLRLYRKKLRVSGKKMIMFERGGKIFTSSNELLLKQVSFIESYRWNKNKGDQNIWPLYDYEPKVIERKIIKEKTLTLLNLSSDGSRLKNSDYTFRRVSPVKHIGMTASLAVKGVVLAVSKSGKRLLIVTLNPESLDAGSINFLYNSSGKQSRMKVISLLGFEAVGEIINGKAKTGDAVAFTGKIITEKGKIIKKKVLTKKEILEKIKRGEKVSKEDLIRVLKEKRRKRKRKRKRKR